MQKYTAIILASRDVGEFDRIYFLYTRENGLVKAMGRGVRKQTAKLAGHLEPGTLSEVYVARSRGMGQITSAITISGFEDIKKYFEKLHEILKIFKFFARHFSEEEKDERIFDLLKSFLGNWENSGEKGEQGKILLEAFWWKLFDFLGHRPETMKCAKCSSPLEEKGEKFFSAVRGGVVCGGCFPGEQALVQISLDQIKLLRIFLANPLEKILKVKAGGRELAGMGRIRREFERYNF
ncbi:MAG TPA: DNA repair protein RecO [Candidatus Bathyarchaeia archaeon]|nr:DNA repair protein RecO [Candidatus Bathyarchaeia archaeon]